MGIIAVDAQCGVARVDEEGSVGALLIVHTKNLLARSSQDMFMIRYQTSVPGISQMNQMIVECVWVFFLLKLQKKTHIITAESMEVIYIRT